jgi:hypothetical protein
MTSDKTRLSTPAVAPTANVAAFLAEVEARTPAPLATGQRGRLIFGLDATMSRQPTWDMACRLQAEMFEEAGKIGGLDMKLVYFRGINECRASPWIAEGARLGGLMAKIDCRGGRTQIGRVLRHTANEAAQGPVGALVFVGDAMEESLDHLCAEAGPLALRGIPAFLFQEGHDRDAERAFREIARLTKGAWCRFDAGSADQLRQLLRAAASYAAGGTSALQALSASSTGARYLLSAMQDGQ